MRGLIGFSGFVGQHLLEQTGFDRIYRSSDIREICGLDFDVLVCAGVPAVKWLANKNPEEDLAVLKELMTHLRSTRARRFILISTIDVYPDANSKEDEDSSPLHIPNHTYGQNRLWFEEQIKKLFHLYHIIRLPALFGRYMKKNYVYDLLHNREDFIRKMNMHSSFQWYNIEHLWSDVCCAVENNLSTMNLFTEPLQTRVIVEDIFPHYMDIFTDALREPCPVEYNLRTKYSELWNRSDGYIKSAAQVLEDLKKFVDNYRPQVVPKQLCISNIAWDVEENDVVLKFLEFKGITKLEVAPTKILDSWRDCDTKIAAERIKNKLKGFHVESLQSVLFNTTGLELFSSPSSRAQLLTHCKRVCDLASNLGAGVIVWGSPKQRLLRGKSYTVCFQIAVQFFKALGDYAFEKNVVIGFEANARSYGCDFCFAAKQAAELVRATDSAGFLLHLDAANMHLEKDDFASVLLENKDILCHVQVSEPFLGTFNCPVVQHGLFSKYLHQIGYSGLVSIEMRRDVETLLSIAQAIACVTNDYYELLASK
ncbi:TIM barrel protein [bacterium]|nr:TIM barrel protein [bacterium]